jgi:ATP-dependent protease ClpP protease subunit
MDWFEIRNGGNDHAEILIYDRIGSGFFNEGVEAKTFVRDLSTLTAQTITLRVNSPGGSVFDGQAIAAAISRHPATVTAYIDGLAASIATVIALAADRVIMNDNALFMIHDPRLGVDGSADDMRSAAALLDKVTDSLVTTYTAKTGMPDADIRAAMAAETWYTAAEAFDAGFVDQVNFVAGKAAASFDLAPYGYLHAPGTTQAAPAARDTIERTVTVETSTPPVAVATDLSGFATTEDVADLARQIAAAVHTPAPERHPLAAYASIGEYAMAVYKGEISPVMNAAPDQVTTDNPGVIPPSWLSDVKNIVSHGRPAITALGVQSAGASGMEIDWPYYDGDIATIVAAQSAQKAALNTALISIKKGTAALATYGAYSDIAYQLLMRSSPSYLDAHNRIMLNSYSLITDNVFADALVAGGTASAVDYDFAADTTGLPFRQGVFACSIEVENATGQPASVILVASDVFAKMGGWSDLTPQPYGTQNVGGTATASTLSVNVSGLPVVHDRNLAAGSIVVTNQTAAAWVEEGPMFATADVVSKLGRDVAVWGMGVTAIFNAKGVRKLTNLTP